LLETPKWKKIYSIPRKLLGETLFSGQAQVDKNPEYKKYIHYNQNFQSNSVFFQDKGKLLKNPKW